MGYCHCKTRVVVDKLSNDKLSTTTREGREGGRVGRVVDLIDRNYSKPKSAFPWEASALWWTSIHNACCVVQV